MTAAPRENRFECSRKAVWAVLHSFVGLLRGVVLFSVKALRDGVDQGFKRRLMLREPRPSSDLSQTPSKNLPSVADGLGNKPCLLRVDENGFIKPSAVECLNALAFPSVLGDEIAKEQKMLLLVDLCRLVLKGKNFMYDAVHLNANGFRFAAGIAAKSLEPVLR